jgi:L-aspartate oxidase
VTRRFLTGFDPAETPVIQTDFLVVGSGIAGLFTALKASDYGVVTVLTKQGTMDSNTDMAQGGIAVALDERDSPQLHREDTLTAGAGLCDESVVEILVNEGPARVGELIRMGADFDKVEGNIVFTREAAHSHARIIHASDATGNEIQRTLVRQCQETSKISVFENSVVLDILTNREGRCIGVLTMERPSGSLLIYLARIVVFATGGAGRLYQNTTNPMIATGDGAAAAYRAGCQLMDLEFVQFHPTALSLPGAPRFLISEAVRGEGACLVNAQGERFMPRYHPQGDLAPRDVVARAIWQELQEGPVYLDATHLGADRVRRRFPSITRTCLQYGLDIGEQAIPIAPAAHYTMGGIKTDSFGRTNLPGFYACGEVACNGVHGANRLASNSLLDGLVFGDRIVRYCREDWLSTPFWTKEQIASFTDFEDVGINHVETWTPQTGFQEFYPIEPLPLLMPLEGEDAPGPAETIQHIQKIMWDQVGLVREAEGLIAAINWLEARENKKPDRFERVEQVEAANLLLLGRLVATAAWLRQESRGAHFRKDFPRTETVGKRHIVMQQPVRLKK